MPSPIFPLLWNSTRVVQEIQKANSIECLHRKPGRKFIGINEKMDKNLQVDVLFCRIFWMALARDERSFFVRFDYVSSVHMVRPSYGCSDTIHSYSIYMISIWDDVFH